MAVDRVISDFTNGTVEWLVEQGEARGDWVLVEGQGSIDHPAYSAVTMGLIHGATPHAMVLVHKPGLVEHDFDHLPEASFPIASLPGFIELHERIAGLVAPSRVVAIACNTSLLSGRRRGARGHRRHQRRDRPAGRRPGALRAGRACGRTSGSGWTPCRGSEPPSRGPVAGPARPVPDRPLGARRRARGSRRSSSSCVTTRYPDVVGVGEGYPDRFYGETPESMAAVMPGPASRRSASRTWTGPVWPALPARWTPRSAGTAPRSAPSTSPCTTWPARSMASRSTTLLGLSTDIPPTDFTLGLDEPAIVAARAQRAGGLPGPQDQVRRPRRPGHPAGGP